MKPALCAAGGTAGAARSIRCGSMFVGRTYSSQSIRLAREEPTIKYRIDAEVKSASDGYGFNITNERGRSIVTFAYVDEPEAEMARALIQNAIINAAGITGYALPR